MSSRTTIIWLLVFINACLTVSCTSKTEPPTKTVTVYCAHDQVHAEHILKAFEAQTGIQVRVKFDTEASKTISLTNAIIAEAASPRCDVFWNNEISQTILLNKRGLLAPYKSPAGQDIPTEFKDSNGAWHGFAARSRVFIVNTNLVKNPSEYPRNLKGYLNPHFKNKVAIAKPLFGTTSTHTAALFSAWGETRAQKFFMDLKANGVVVCAGNAHLKDRVSRGELAFGLTDTDDFNLAREAGAPVVAVFPGQDTDEGCLVIPNTVAMIKNSPHQDTAKRLVDYLLSHKVEQQLATGRAAHIPLRQSIQRPSWIPKSLKARRVDWDDVAKNFPRSRSFIQEQFLSD